MEVEPLGLGEDREGAERLVGSGGLTCAQFHFLPFHHLAQVGQYTGGLSGAGPFLKFALSFPAQGLL